MATTGSRWVGRRALSAGLAFSFLTTTIVGVTPRPVEAALSDEELAAAEGLVLAFGAMAGVDGLDELGDALPFTGILATGASGLAVVDGFTDLAMDVVAAIGQVDPTVDDIENAINGSRTVGGATIEVDADITGSSVTFNTLSFTRDDVTVPLGFLSGEPDDPATFSLAGGDLAIDLALAFDGLTLTDDGSGLGIDAPAQPAQLTVATELATPSIATQLGILDVTADGTVTADLTFDVEWVDPDSSGSITSFELEHSAPLDLLDVSIAAGSDVAMNVTLTSTLQGLGGIEGTIVLDHDLSEGSLPAPTVDFGPNGELGDFTNMTAGDVLASIVHLATSLRSMQLVTGNPQLPLIDQNLGEFADWTDQLSRFFVDLGLSTPANPLDVNIEPEEGTACGNAVDDDGDGYVDEGCPGQPNDLVVRGLTTIEGIIEQLEIGLDVNPGDLGLAYDSTTRSVVFAIEKNSTFTQEPLSAELNIADELQGAGISSVQLDGDLSVSAVPQYGMNIGVGIDLSDALSDPSSTSLTERVFIQPAAGDEPELFFDAPVSANIEGSARIAMLEIEIADDNGSGAIPILAKRSTDPSPMIELDIAGLGDDRITLAELFAGMSEVGRKEGTPDNEFTIEVPGAFTATAAANLAVPLFALGVEGSVGSTSLGSAEVTFSWPDVFVGDPTVAGDTDFNDDFLSFNIDPSDPQALFTAVLTAIDQALALVEDIGGDDLDRELPAIGTSFSDLLGWVDPVQDAVNALAADPAGTLDLLELTIEAAIAQALDGLTDDVDFALPTLPVPTDPIFNPDGEFELAEYQAAVAAYIGELETALGDATSFVTFDYEPGNSPGALLINLDVGVCSVKADHPGCSFEFPITEDFNFDTAEFGTALSGIAAAEGEGTVTLDYGVVASVHLGVELPVTEAAPSGGVLPEVTSPFRVFLADTSGIQASLAGELVNAEFEASVGPFGIQAGETDALPETLIADACSAGNTDDDDEDNFVNDGCPVVPNFEQGADCANTTDDDGDGVVNDGCPEVGGASETDADCTNATDDDNDGDPDTDDADGAVNDGCPTVAGPSDGEPEADCDNATDDDGDGDVNDGCAAQGNPLIAKAGAEFSLVNQGPTADTDRFYLNDAGSDPSIGDFFSGIEPDITPIDGLNCDNGAGTFLACAHLPIYGFLGDADDQVFLGNIDFTWADFDTAPSLTGADEVLVALQAAGEAFLFDLLAQGIGALGDAVEQGVSAAAYDVSVPVVGDVLDGGAEVAAKFNTQVVDPIESLVGSLNGAEDFATIKSEISDFWWEQLNGDEVGDAPRLILDRQDPAATPTKEDDIIVEVLCGNPLEDCETLDGDDNPVYTLLDLREVSFRMAIGQHAEATAPNFEWGVPGLRLEGDAPLAASVDWRINFGAGVGIDDGFFFLTNTDVNDGNQGDAGNDIEVNAAVDFGPTTKGTDPLDDAPPALNGDLAFLSAALWNAKDTTPSDDRFDRAHEVSLAVGIDLFGDPAAPVAGERIRLPQLIELINPTKWTVNLDGYIDVNATVATTAALGGGASDGAIPRLLADIHLGWELDTTAGELLDGGFTPEQFMAEFVDVRLDLGSFISEFLGPVLAEVQNLTKPLQPIIDTLQAPIPGVSELAELVGADPITLLDLMEVVSGADLTLIRRLLQVVSFANSLPTNVDLVIPIGGFELEQNALLGTELPATSKDQLVAGDGMVDPTAEGGGVLGQLGAAGGANFSEQVALSQGEGGFSFPAFDDPSKLFNLLVGQDVELIEFDAGELKAEIGWSQSFGPIAVGPIPVSVVVSIGAAVEGRFVIGYDTKGIRGMIQNLSDGDDSNDGFFDGLGTLVAGVYISDLADDGSDPPEIRLTLEGSVGAAVDLVVIKAGIEAGLRATLDLNLHDGGFLDPVPPENLDGKLRIDEIITFLSNPICLFDVSGKLEAFIRIFVTLDLFLFSVTYKQTIVNIVLLELENITAELCQPPEPEPASKSGGTLILNVGDRADIRNFDVGNADEKIVVRQISPGTTGDVEVSYKGYTELYEDIDLIVGDGDEGDDTFVFEDGDISGTCRADGAVDPPVPGFWSIDSDTGDVIETGESCLDEDVAVGDTASFLVNFDIALSICGGPGSDVIGGSDNDDLLVGDGELNGDLLCEDNGPAGGGVDDVDTINGGGGDDEIHGNAGPDILEGGSGDDQIYGGDQADEIIGGIGADRLYGQNGNDGISGGPETDPCPNDDHDDCPDGADAADYVEGGEGDDSIEGDHGDDDLNGNGGNDTIVGGLGDDTINGNEGIDNLFGNEGIDTMNGGDGDDDMYGGSGDDVMSGGNHDDDMVGGEGIDQIDGDDGRDVILGDLGGINRDPDPDVGVVSDFTPSAGKLLVELTSSAVPLAGGDDIDGGGDADRIWGQEGDDQIDGDDGPGSGGDDIIRGNEGNDDIRGNAGADEIFGNDGDDVIYGDAAPGNTDPSADGSDNIRGGNGDDVISGNAKGDRLFGDSGDDVIYGDATFEEADCADDADFIVGGSGNDLVFGNADADDIFGEGGTDRLIGGSDSADECDGDDAISGGQQGDVIAGDNATIADGDTQDDMLVVLILDGRGEGDHDLDGDDGDDRIFGQVGDDTINGGSGHDYVEGNEGTDTVAGNAGSDDLIGGSSAADGIIDDDRVGDGRPDAGDFIDGDDDQGGIDWIAGDNALISRNAPASGRAPVHLFDVATYEPPVSPSATTYGVDEINGGGGFDLIFGQGAGDVIHGDSGNDYIEGNDGDDSIYGDAGDDDLVGGGSAADGMIVPGRVGDGLADVGETLILGGDGEDWIAGDNALIDRNLDAAAPSPIRLFDVETVGNVFPMAGGPETVISGGDGEDWIFGQTGGDLIYGNAGDDYIEGNNGDDAIHGNDGDDDIVGGGSANDGLIDDDRVGDGLLDVGENVVTGGNGDDWIAGDNALVNRNRPIADGPDGPQRAPIELFDVQTSGGPSISPTVSGGDLLQGNGGEDRIFGQGNGAQPADQTDPVDGRNNDYNSAVEGSGDFDRFPDDVTAIDEDGSHLAGWLGDTILGGADDDEIEGNHGNDLIYGNGDEDDIVGGGSADDGKIWPETRLLDGANLLDGTDIIHGDDGAPTDGDHDVIVGDNGWVGRTGATITGVGPDGVSISLTVRRVTMVDAQPDPLTFGDDFVAGNGGHDEMYGQAGDDMLEGQYGSDAMIGDLGTTTTELLGDDDEPNVLCGEPEFLEPQQPFVGEDICVDGTLFRLVQLYAFDDTAVGAVEGRDVMIGGDGDDWMHGGAGSDLLQGDGDGGAEIEDADADYTFDVVDPNPASADKDRIFGGDSNGNGTVDPVLGGDGDVSWGGRGDDYTWAGNGDDMIDVRPDGTFPATWEAWAAADVESYHGIDVSYGGWDQDAAQANVAANGPIAGDRMLDWAGVYNISYLCPASYGAYVTVRGQPPQLIQWVIDLAAASGAFDPGTAGSSGYNEVAMVYKKDVKANTNPIYPGTPGHFSCSP